MTLTLLKAWQSAKQRLEAAGLAGPVIDARLLVEAAADATRADIVADPHRALTPEQETTLTDYLARREKREPVSHILGRKGFWKIMLNVTPDVLTPRPDTETVVEYVLRDFPEHAAWSILDLGVGSGVVVTSEAANIRVVMTPGIGLGRILHRQLRSLPTGRRVAVVLQLLLAIGIPRRPHPFRFARHLRVAVMLMTMLTCVSAVCCHPPCG